MAVRALDKVWLNHAAGEHLPICMDFCWVKRKKRNKRGGQQNIKPTRDVYYCLWPGLVLQKFKYGLMGPRPWEQLDEKQVTEFTSCPHACSPVSESYWLWARGALTQHIAEWKGVWRSPASFLPNSIFEWREWWIEKRNVLAHYTEEKINNSQ